MEIPSRQEAEKAFRSSSIDEWTEGIKWAVVKAYVEGRLIEPMSREEIDNIVGEYYPVSGMRTRIVDALLGKVGKVQEDKPTTVTEVQHKLDGEKHKAFVEWAFNNSILYGHIFTEWWASIGVKDFFKWAEKRGYDLMKIDGGKPHVELTEEDVAKIIRTFCTSRSGHQMRREDVFIMCRELAQEIVRAMKGVK